VSTKKKIQHYVPQCYLESWCIPNSHQLYVYDKKMRKQRINHIHDVASEKSFYDLDFSGILSDELIKEYGLEDVDLSQIDEEQYIENCLSNIEGSYKIVLQRIINKVMNMSIWEIKNCYFIDINAIVKLSINIAIQFVRVKLVRTSIADDADCMEQILTDMGAPEKLKKKYQLSEQELKIIHGRMILNRKQIATEAHIFANHIWILLLNKTSQPFYTSDNPIGTREHIQNPLFPMSGIACKGVEVFFPISPQLMLLMFEREYHSDKDKYDRRIIESDRINVIREYNAKIIVNSQRCTFSPSNDFSPIVDTMLKNNPEILDIPHTITSFGGKNYYPRKK